MTSVIASIIDKYLMMLPGDRNMMEREFTRLETTVRDVGTAVGQSGHITRVTAGNVIFGETDGIKLLNPSIGRYSIDLQSDGDAFFGSDTSAPDHTALAIFSNSQRYNGELFGAGDLLVGDNSSGKANLQWDASTGRLNFRGGATTNAYISAAGYLNATGATISGTITAAAGSIGGWTINATNIKKTGIELSSANDAIYVGAAAPRLVIDGASKSIYSSNYASGVSGFSINGATGDAEFNNITARGEIRTAVLAYGEIQATAGTLGVFKSAGKLREDRMTQANFNIDIEDPATGHMQLFAVNDILRIKDTSGDFWLRVTGVSNLGTYYRYAVTLTSGSTGATIKAGAAVVDYGPGGTGFITLSADGTVGSSANMTIGSHAGSPWSAQTTLVRLGNLNGSYGVASDYYGIGIGDYTNGNYLRYDTNGGFVVRAGNGNVSLSSAGLSLTGGAAGVNSIVWKSGVDTIYTVNGARYDVGGDIFRISPTATGPVFAIYSNQGVGSNGYTYFDKGSFIIGQNFNDFNNTAGLVVNQGAKIDEIITLKSSTVSHGMTDITGDDTYGFAKVVSSTAGGLYLAGMSEATAALYMVGLSNADDTAKNASALGNVMVQASKRSGTGVAAPGANANLFVIRSAGSARWMVDQEGDTYRDGTDSAYDAWDDLALARTFDLEVSSKTVIRDEFDNFLKYNRADLIRAGILTDGGFYNESALLRLHNGALGQIAKRLMAIEQKLLPGGSNGTD
jgi:hypothetical protein